MSGLFARWRGWRLAVGVLLAGLAVTAALTAVSLVLYEHNEDRLLGLRVRELGLVLGGALPATSIPLASAAALAEGTGGDKARLRILLAPEVGPHSQFVSVSLWPLQVSPLKPTAVFGSAPALASDPARAAAFFAHVAKTPVVNVIGILHSGTQLRLGYGFSTPHSGHGFAIYAETALPTSRRSRLSANSAFASLNYVLYLGRTQRPSALLVTNLARLPIRGRHASTVVPFGDSAFTLVVSARTTLGGVYLQLLPWIIAAAGLLLSIAAALLTDRLVRRRRDAEDLAERLDRIAAENRRLYAEQRTIAETLQHALLPEALPDVDGLRAGVRYVAGISGIDIGGDWYDLVSHREGTALVIVGDVSGRGVRAATTMASLRFAALAYAAVDDAPGTILSKLANFVDEQEHGYFATVLCARLDVAAHTVTIASAGHLPPLAIDDGRATYLPLKVGGPIGAGGSVDYEELTVAVAQRATLVAFTDGLVERRGEVLDVGLARLSRLATTPFTTLDELLTRLVTELPVNDGHDDDTAILAVQWER